MRTLADILVCPNCKSSLTWNSPGVSCQGCHEIFPIIDTVPVFVKNPQVSQPPTVQRENYDAYMVKPVLKTLDRSCVVLDIGSGGMGLNHPNIIRLELSPGPYVDVVADATNLPFKDASVDFLFSTAVLEHLPNPFSFADESFRVCSRGGYCYAETNFVWPYHGYPYHFFNFSVTGIERVFGQFRKIQCGVPSNGYPPFTLAIVVDYFLALFRPQNRSDRKLVETLKKILKFPLRTFKLNDRFDYEAAKTLAAVTYFFGIKQSSNEAIIPTPILSNYLVDTELQKHFPDPYDLIAPENIWTLLRDSVGLEEDYARRVLFGKRGENSGAISDPILA